MDNFFMAHIEDLSLRSGSKNIYTFSNFLSEDEQNEIMMHRKSLTEFSFFGGTEGTQRKMVRFGNEEELFYSEEFPIDCIKAEPLNKKFADRLSHRDVLGAIMNLSVEREHIGDIIIKEDCSFIFVTKKMSEYIKENLKKIRHTDVKCSLCTFSDDESLFTLEEKIFISSSLRADCVISAVYNLSRNQASEMFRAKKVFINSRQCESTSKILSENDTVSVRGYGKFIYTGCLSKTKKDRLKISVSIYA